MYLSIDKLTNIFKKHISTSYKKVINNQHKNTSNKLYIYISNSNYSVSVVEVIEHRWFNFNNILPTPILKNIVNKKKYPQKGTLIDLNLDILESLCKMNTSERYNFVINKKEGKNKNDFAYLHSSMPVREPLINEFKSHISMFKIKNNSF